MSRPNGVRVAAREDRSSSRWPKCRSNAATRRLATDCAMRAAAAPTVKLPRSLTCMNARQAPTRSMAPLCQNSMGTRARVLDGIALRAARWAEARGVPRARWWQKFREDSEVSLMTHLLGMRRGAAWAAGVLAVAALPACGQETAPADEAPAGSAAVAAADPVAAGRRGGGVRRTGAHVRRAARRLRARHGHRPGGCLPGG